MNAQMHGFIDYATQRLIFAETTGEKGGIAHA